MHFICEVFEKASVSPWFPQGLYKQRVRSTGNEILAWSLERNGFSWQDVFSKLGLSYVTIWHYKVSWSRSLSHEELCDISTAQFVSYFPVRWRHCRRNIGRLFFSLSRSKWICLNILKYLYWSMSLAFRNVWIVTCSETSIFCFVLWWAGWVLSNFRNISHNTQG